MTTSYDEYAKIIKMSYGFFSVTPCTPETMTQFVSMMETSLIDCPLCQYI